MMRYWFLVFMMNGIVVSSLEAQDKRVIIPGTDQQIDLVLLDRSVFTSTMGQKLEIPSYYIGVYEITHDQFRVFQERDFDTDDADDESYKADAVTRPSPPYEDFTKGMGKEGGYPAVSITQQGALRYCQWLYEKTGVFFRLPTEIEWHNACQKGGGGNLDDQAWYFENSLEKFHKVGEKAPNAIGLYDMFGNVAEWTADEYAMEFPLNLKNDIWVQPTKRHSRTVKGGSYLSDPKECKCHYRERSDPRWQMRDPQVPKSLWWNTDAPFVGFRVVVPEKQLEKVEVDAYFEKAIID